MNKKTVYEQLPTDASSRAGEGSFLRTPDGQILFGYSEFSSDPDDGARSDIALLRSSDEGENFERCGVIVRAADLGVKNVMCVSALPTEEGEPCFYFLIKEEDGNTSFGRAISADGGVTFRAERCRTEAPGAYYVLENDRMIRTRDGRILTAASRHDPAFTHADIVTFESTDGGASFHARAEGKIRGTRGRVSDSLEEPGLLELPDGRIYVWARTYLGSQYQAYADARLEAMSTPEPSRFSSPRSPMILKRVQSGAVCAVYNPIPAYVGREDISGGPFDRTPLLLEISRDGTKTFPESFVIEDAKRHSFCYPAVFETKEGALLVAYMYENEDFSPKDALRIVKIR